MEKTKRNWVVLWELFWFIKLLFGLRKNYNLFKRKELDYICFYKLFLQDCLSIDKALLHVCDDIINIFEYRLLKKYIASVSSKATI